jgi:uncharacterized DUF497 family protein
VATLEFEWDEAKRVSNVAKHGLDFVRIARLLDGPHVTIRASGAHGEERLLLTGKFDGRGVTAAVTWRADKMRIISLRSARNDEWRRYQALHCGRA